MSDGVVVFSALIGSTLQPTSLGIYAWKNGKTIKLLSTLDTLAGKPVAQIGYTHRGFSGNELVLYVRFGTPGAFVDLGPSGIGGALGEPVLTGTGDLAPGSATGFSLSCSGAQPFALGHAFLGTSVNPTPFYGGTFYPLPFVKSLTFGFDAAGSFAASTTIPASYPAGTPIALQFFFLDATAPFGVAGSNGLRLDVP